MPNIKIYYFDFPFWRAEVSRLALHLGNVSNHCLIIKYIVYHNSNTVLSHLPSQTL